MKTLLKLCIVAAFLLSFTGHLLAETSNRVVAFVNDEVITLHELKKKIEEMTGQTCEGIKAQDEQKYIETRREILEILINEKITQEKVKELGLQVTEGEVDNAVEDIKTANQLTQEELIEQLNKEGLTYEKLRQKIKDDMERGRLIEYEVKSKTIVREEQIEEYYQKHRDEFKKEDQVHIASIFLVQINPHDENEHLALLKKGEEILSRIGKGEEFSTLAKEFSQGPGAAEGGDLGVFKSSQIDNELLNILNDLPEGGVSNLIDRGNGVQIIKLLKKENARISPIEEVREQIYNIIYQEQINKRYMSWIKEIREDCFTKIIF